MPGDQNQDIAVKKSLIEKKLEESGEKERLEEYLRQKLIESGWKDELKAHCIEIIRTKGLDKINLEDLVEELLPKGRGLQAEMPQQMVSRKVMAVVLLVFPANALSYKHGGVLAGRGGGARGKHCQAAERLLVCVRSDCVSA